MVGRVHETALQVVPFPGVSIAGLGVEFVDVEFVVTFLSVEQLGFALSTASARVVVDDLVVLGAEPVPQARGPLVCSLLHHAANAINTITTTTAAIRIHSHASMFCHLPPDC